MSFTKTLYGILSKFGIWITPLVLVLFSLCINLPNADLHKNTLRRSAFYTNLSQELQQGTKENREVNKSFGVFLLTTIISDLATPGWIQNLFDQNIDLFTTWLIDPNQNLNVYLPAKEIELAVGTNIDEQTRQLKQDFGEQIKVCNASEEEKIKAEGFRLEGDFCLPQQVKDGKVSLTEFTEAGSDQVLSDIVRNNPINSNTEKFEAKDFLSFSNFQMAFLNQLNRLRDIFIKIYQIRFWMILFVVIIFSLYLVLAKALEKLIYKETRSYLFYTAINTFSLSALVILALGASTYFTSFIQNLILPGFKSTRLINLISLEMVKFGFNIISTAVWISIGMLIVSLLTWFMQRSGMFEDTDLKNQKLAQVAVPSQANQYNATFDGEFRRNKLEAPVTPYSANYSDNQTLQNFSTPATPVTPFMEDELRKNPDELEKIKNLGKNQVNVTESLLDEMDAQNNSNFEGPDILSKSQNDDYFPDNYYKGK